MTGNLTRIKREERREKNPSLSHSERSEETLRLTNFAVRDSSGYALRMTLFGGIHVRFY